MRSALSLVLAAAPLLVGCGSHQCSSMGCVTGATLELSAPLTESGEYAITLSTGDQEITCAAFVPLRRDGSEPTCDGMLINRAETTTRSGDAVIGTAGDSIESVWIGGRHERLELAVSRDGAEVLRSEVAPVYRGVEINGEGCGECPMATETIGD